MQKTTSFPHVSGGNLDTKNHRHSRGLLAGIQTLKEARHSHAFLVGISTLKKISRHSRGLLAGIQTLKEARHSRTFNKPSLLHAKDHVIPARLINRHSYMQKTTSFPHVFGGNLDTKKNITSFPRVVGENPGTKKPSSFPHVSGGNLKQVALQQHQGMTHFLHRHSYMQKTTSFPHASSGNLDTKKPTSFPHVFGGNLKPKKYALLHLYPHKSKARRAVHRRHGGFAEKNNRA